MCRKHSLLCINAYIFHCVHEIKIIFSEVGMVHFSVKCFSFHLCSDLRQAPLKTLVIFALLSGIISVLMFVMFCLLYTNVVIF